MASRGRGLAAWGLGTLLVFGLGLLLSYVSTSVVADGDFPATLVHVQLTDASTGAPLSHVSARGRRNGEDADFLIFPKGAQSDLDGLLDIQTARLRYGYHGWRAFWLVWIGSARDRWSVEFECAGYEAKTVGLEELLASEHSSGIGLGGDDGASLANATIRLVPLR